jgi:uncharacterized protein YukE
MVTGFYGTLAAAASVFIGILTALLASNLSNLNAQRERIEQRIETIDAQLENLDIQYNHFKDTLDEIREQEAANQRREQAEEQIDRFIEEHVGVEFDISPEDLSPRKVQREFADYLGQDQLFEEQHNVLQERYEDIESALTPTSPFAMASIPDEAFVDSEIIASNHQIANQWEIHQEERFNRNYRRWVQTMTEIRSLQDERERLVDRHESLDPSRIRGSLRATVVTIILSIGVPVLAYLFRVSGVVMAPNIQTWIEPTVIFAIWVGGLVYVFKHLRDQLDEENGEIRDEPEVSLDEEEPTLQ